MGQGQRVALTLVFRMLEHCAGGYTARATKHHYIVTYQGKTFRSLPLGEHGRARSTGRAEIYLGHVRAMVGALEIDRACAWEVIENLYT